MRLFALSAVGRDRPGIVAAVSRVLLDRRVNIEDSQMTILRGHFAMTLILAAPDETDAESLRAELDDVRAELGLDAISLNDVEEAGAEAELAPSHTVSVYGVDHPGIVHAVASALASREWSITDLTTRVVGGESNPLYVMLIEVALPAGTTTEELADLLRAVGESQGVEITARALDQEAL